MALHSVANFSSTSELYINIPAHLFDYVRLAEQLLCIHIHVLHLQCVCGTCPHTFWCGGGLGTQIQSTTLHGLK